MIRCENVVFPEPAMPEHANVSALGIPGAWGGDVAEVVSTYHNHHGRDFFGGGTAFLGRRGGCH